MAGTVISAKYPPRIDPTRTTLAYGNRALPRLVSIIGLILSSVDAFVILTDDIKQTPGDSAPT